MSDEKVAEELYRLDGRECEAIGCESEATHFTDSDKVMFTLVCDDHTGIFPDVELARIDEVDG